MAEKDTVRRILQDLVIEIMWNPLAVEGHSETREHDVRVWKDNGEIKVIIRRKQCS